MATKILYIILFISSICFGQISRNPQFVQFLQYDTSYTATGQEPIGTRYWDDAEGTTSLVLDNGVILQDGQEVYYPVINQTGGELENGKVAHYDGTNGNSGTLKIDYSVASKTSVISYFLGVITETIPNGGTGKVTRFGKVRGIQTNGADYGETWEDGDVLYVSTVNAGGMTNVMPTAPNPAIKIGWVISAHNTNGTIFVAPSYPDRLEDLSDINGKPLVNTGQIPVWNNTSEFFDFTHRIETTLAKTDTSLTTGKGIANYTQAVKDSIYTKVNPTFTAGDSSTTMRIGDASQSFGSVLRLSGGTSSGSAIAFRNYLNIVDSSDATGRVAIFSGISDATGGGLWAFGKDHDIGGDTTKRGIVEIFTNSERGTTSLGGALRWLMYDGAGFKLRYSGTKDGAHTWYDETGAKLGAWETDNYFNSILGYKVNGTNINTTGTLSNVAYKGQNNNFTAGQSITGTTINTGGLYARPSTFSTGFTQQLFAQTRNNEAGTEWSQIRMGQIATNTMFIEAHNQADVKGSLILAPYGTGKVGIRNTSPTEALDVTGNIKASGTGNFGNTITQNLLGTVGYGLVTSFSGTYQNAFVSHIARDVSNNQVWRANWNRNSANTQYFLQFLNGSDAYYWNAIGFDYTNKRVGINTLTPAEVLDVNGNIKASGTITAPTLTASTTVTAPVITQQSTSAYESAPLGSELLSSSNWTSTDWTGDFASGFTHTTGNTTALTNTLAAVTNNLYQITYTVTNRTAGTFTITFGGVTTSSLSATGAVGIKATSTGTLSIAPTADFNGTIVISIKQITSTYNPTYVIKDNAGNNTFEIRSGLASLNNTFIGVNAGRYNTTGNRNSAQGYASLYSLTTGNQNSAQGYASLFALTTGNNNTAQGVYSLFSLTTGTFNTAQGYNAGRYLANGSTAHTTGDYGTYIGADTKAKEDGTTNETVIGYNAIGNGSNTVTIGSSAVTANYFNGFVQAGSFRLSALNTAPASPTDTGTTGEIRIVDGYIYVCVATNTWKRTQLTTW